MKLTNTNLIEIEPGDPFVYRIDRSPNSKLSLKPKAITLHFTGYASVENAVVHYKKPQGLSVHLILDKNGVDFTQMIEFDRQAIQSHGQSPVSIDIALDHVGSVLKPDTTSPRDYVISMSSNRPKKCPLYSREQIDGLLMLCAWLRDQFRLDTLQGHEELDGSAQDPGAAFPIIHFREKLFGEAGGGIVLEELVNDIQLRNGPEGELLIDEIIPRGTKVSIVDDWQGWVRIEVMEPVGNNPWAIGWVETRCVQAATSFIPMVKGDRLYTTTGRPYKFLPAYSGNYETKKAMVKDDVKFVVMHITTGTRMQSTVNYFRSPTAHVSAHLVIGRDGRIVQMVPFDRAAYHAGAGSWEGQGQMNLHSIGIEVDNAGTLTKKTDGSFARGSTPIPADQVCETKHWKSYRARPWQKFTDIQIAVTKQVVKALAEYFQLSEIIEHESISLRNRSDPGPLFPMREVRKLALGREDALVKVYTVMQGAPLYENSCFQPPEEDYPKYEAIMPKCEVIIQDDNWFYWSKIEIKDSPKPNWKGRIGWVRKSSIKYEKGKAFTTVEQDLYKDRGKKYGPPSLPLEKGLPKDGRLRIQKSDPKGWSLIAPPENKEGFGFLEGWVLSSLLDPKPT